MDSFALNTKKEALYFCKQKNQNPEKLLKLYVIHNGSTPKNHKGREYKELEEELDKSFKLTIT